MSENAHGWANPTAGGFAALGLALFGFYALFGGKVEHTAIPLFGLWLLGGFVVQFVVGIIELKEGSTTGGNTFLVFSAFFALVGGLSFIFKYFAVINNWPLDATIDGYMFLVLALVLTLWTPGFLKGSPMVLSVIIMILDVGLFFIAFMDLKLLTHAFALPTAYLCLTAGILCIYLSAAIVVNTAFGKAVFPVGTSIIK